MFELSEDGKIREWREYYDNAYWTGHGGPSLEM
jgi:limonene-1,2-epoxide hydrolase